MTTAFPILILDRPQLWIVMLAFVRAFIFDVVALDAARGVNSTTIGLYAGMAPTVFHAHAVCLLGCGWIAF